MNKSGIGVGSASIVLIFAVLCLTIFTLITYMSANTEMALANAEAELVKSYYEADTLAERIIDELVSGASGNVLGAEIKSEWDWDMLADITEFSCPMSERKELYVKIALYEDNSYDILSWRMRDAGEWETDAALPVWTGEDSIEQITGAD